MGDKIEGKKKYQDIGDAVGMPDAQDKAHIEKILLAYDKKHPGEIQFHRDFAKNNSTAGTNEYGLVSGKTGNTGISSNGLRYMFELPPEVHAKIEEYIPTIFRSKKHFNWFKKNFKYLMIPEKY